MRLIFFLLLCLHPQDADYLDQADALRADKKYFGAENLYLSQEPDPEQIARVAYALGDISLRMGSLDQRAVLYQGYLARSRTWRGVASLTLACLDVARSDYAAFAVNAGIYFSEYAADHPVRYRLLYHLARYTTTDPATLNLSPDERTWFDAARALDPALTAPVDPGIPGLPGDLRRLWLLETSQTDNLPEPDDAATPEEQYVLSLAHLRAALMADDEAAAARWINRITPLDQALDRPDLSLHFYPLLARFFTERNEPDRADRALRNLQLVQRWALLPIVVDGDHLLYRPVPAAPEPDEAPARDATEVAAADSTPDAAATETEPADADTAPAETAADQPADAAPAEPADAAADTAADAASEAEHDAEGDVYAAYEQRLLAGDRGLELSVRKLEPETTYRKIYRNYLLGLHYLKAARTVDALDRLRVAQAQVESLPFPALEIKIHLAVADCYEAEGDRAKADWGRLQALSIWTAPQHLPLFARAGQAPPAPTDTLLDAALGEPAGPDRVHRILQYHEAARFQALMQRAYARETLCVNPVLGNQLTLIGSQLARQVDSLADNPSHTPDPRRYNDTLEIWNQLWQQTLPYYRESGTPSLTALQAALGTRDRLVSFVEGRRKLGVLVLSHDQAFALPLGDKGAFGALNDDERMGFLTGRLGTFWDNEGKLFVALSSSYRDTALLARLRAKLNRPERLQVIFSLKSFQSTKQRGTCTRAAWFGEGEPPFSLPQSVYAEPFRADGLDRAELESILETHDHLIYAGPLGLTPRGLAFGPAAEAVLYFHEIVHYNPRLCSLTLVGPKGHAWATLLDELELLSPSGSVRFNLVDGAPGGESLNLNESGMGVRFP